MNGVELIAAERKRQVEDEGYSAEHDGGYHADQSLVWAAVCYAAPCHVLAPPPGGRFSPKAIPALRDPWPWTDGDKRLLPRPINPNDLMPHMDDGHSLSLPHDDERQGVGIESQVRELRIRELTRAGALIAAEIDRLQRAEGEETGNDDD